MHNEILMLMHVFDYMKGFDTCFGYNQEFADGDVKGDSIARLNKIVSRLMIRKGVQAIRIELEFCDSLMATDISKFAEYHLEILREETVFVEMAMSDDYYADVSEEEIFDALEKGNARIEEYQSNWGYQEELQKDDFFIDAIATAMAQMPSAFAIHKAGGIPTELDIKVSPPEECTRLSLSDEDHENLTAAHYDEYKKPGDDRSLVHRSLEEGHAKPHFSLGSAITQRSWPRLRSVRLDGIVLDFLEPEQFVHHLKPKIDDIGIRQMHLLSGTLAEALNIFRNMRPQYFPLKISRLPNRYSGRAEQYVRGRRGDNPLREVSEWESDSDSYSEKTESEQE
ncbi:uncharacterized protein PAC_13635 [Phialocephala subalpina]|uniref:Uncharacterized protein n=1 Tax=Phialocephala subalpina TaxID=576137 RepID=A0A1L7XFF8_9HELO|nr:uncharacterized protein PAC_13635 [Phialocephala subalpina]